MIWQRCWEISNGRAYICRQLKQKSVTMKQAIHGWPLKKQNETDNVHWKQSVTGRASVIKHTKNEPVVGKKFYHRTKTLSRSREDTLVMNKQDKGS